MSTNLSELALFEAVRANCELYFTAFASLPTISHYADDRVAWLIAPSPPGTSVHRTRISGDVDGQIAAVLEAMREREAHYGWWQVFPSSEPADLGVHLLAHGLKRIDPRPWMIADLTQPAAALRVVPGLRLERVGNPQQLADWYISQWRGFESTPAQAATYYDAYLGLGFASDAAHQSYVAYLDGQPVAGGTVLMQAEVAGIYDVATDPAARGRGIGSAITAALMQMGWERGCQYATLQPSDDSYRMYQRLGFVERFSEDNYAWRLG